MQTTKDLVKSRPDFKILQIHRPIIMHRWIFSTSFNPFQLFVTLLSKIFLKICILKVLILENIDGEEEEENGRDLYKTINKFRLNKKLKFAFFCVINENLKNIIKRKNWLKWLQYIETQKYITQIKAFLINY